MKFLSVVGARPQFVKLAPIAHAAAAKRLDHIIVHTGQHYDPLLSDVFFDDLGIPPPDVNLGIGSGSHGVQTGAIMAALDGVLDECRPDWTLAYGDTNSTLAAAVCAVKLHLPLAHLEAGLRSFNRNMPEEHNRVLTDHAADLLLAPTQVAMDNLAAEGLTDRTIVVGDVMTDVLYGVRDKVLARPSGIARTFATEATGFYLATIHRAENTDTPERLASILDALAALDRPVILMAHPRLVAKAGLFGLSVDRPGLVHHAPLAYPDLIEAVMASDGVVTDSGGLQKEAFLLRVPCATVRTETEWTETVDLGWNVLTPDPTTLAAAVVRERPRETVETPYGDGHAAGRVIDALLAADNSGSGTEPSQG
jgi:UDP-N-acetylglucosamine 2-epimerase (non-hydrolysing)